MTGAPYRAACLQALHGVEEMPNSVTAVYYKERIDTKLYSYRTHSYLSQSKHFINPVFNQYCVLSFRL